MIQAQGGTAMISDLIHSCANRAVAEAALKSLGAPFSERIRAAARKSGVLDAGGFVALEVRRFARSAGEDDMHDLVLAMRGEDQPVLAGLRFILERVLERQTGARLHPGMMPRPEAGQGACAR